MFRNAIRQIRQAETIGQTGKIENIVGMSIEASGSKAAVGDICRIYSDESSGQIAAESVERRTDSHTVDEVKAAALFDSYIQKEREKIKRERKKTGKEKEEIKK